MSKKIVLIIFVLLFIFFSWSLIGQIITTLESEKRLQAATDKLHSLEIKNQELKKQLEQVKEPEFIESQARDKLGLLKDGETLVIIPETTLKDVLGESKENLKEKLPNPLGWWNLFFKRD